MSSYGSIRPAALEVRLYRDRTRGPQAGWRPGLFHLKLMRKGNRVVVGELPPRPYDTLLSAGSRMHDDQRSLLRVGDHILALNDRPIDLSMPLLDEDNEPDEVAHLPGASSMTALASSCELVSAPASAAAPLRTLDEAREYVRGLAGDILRIEVSLSRRGEPPPTPPPRELHASPFELKELLLLAARTFRPNRPARSFSPVRGGWYDSLVVEIFGVEQRVQRYAQLSEAATAAAALATAAAESSRAVPAVPMAGAYGQPNGGGGGAGATRRGGAVVGTADALSTLGDMGGSAVSSRRPRHGDPSAGGRATTERSSAMGVPTDQMAQMLLMFHPVEYHWLELRTIKSASVHESADVYGDPSRAFASGSASEASVPVRLPVLPRGDTLKLTLFRGSLPLRDILQRHGEHSSSSNGAGGIAQPRAGDEGGGGGGGGGATDADAARMGDGGSTQRSWLAAAQCCLPGSLIEANTVRGASEEAKKALFRAQRRVMSREVGSGTIDVSSQSLRERDSTQLHVALLAQTGEVVGHIYLAVRFETLSGLGYYAAAACIQAGWRRFMVSPRSPSPSCAYAQKTGHSPHHSLSSARDAPRVMLHA